MKVRTRKLRTTRRRGSRRFRPRLTYANITATLALFLALGGVGYASGLLTGADIADDSLTASDIAPNTLGFVETAASPYDEIKDGTIDTLDVANNALTGTDVDESTLTGVPGTVRAYGSVRASGTLLASKNVAAVTRPSPGVWCIQISGFAGSSKPVATPINTYATGIKNGLKAWAEVDGAPEYPCPNSQYVQITTGLQKFEETSVMGATPKNVLSEVRYERSPEPFTFVVP